MGQKFNKLQKEHHDFIREQKIFFSGTAAATGQVNVSPKGLDSLRIISDTRIVWLNYTGSGNETAAHLMQNPRMTIMFCSFGENPLILRLYGKAEILHEHDNLWEKYIAMFPETDGARQLFLLDITLVQSSCGFGVPFYEFKGERTKLAEWIKNKGDSIKNYRKEKNSLSLDGFSTDISDK